MSLGRIKVPSSGEGITGGGFIGDIFNLLVPEADRLLGIALRSSFTGVSIGLQLEEGGKFIPLSAGPWWYESVASCPETKS